MLIASALLALAWPTVGMLAGSVWASDAQGHGPLIVLAALALLAQHRHALAALGPPTTVWPGWTVVGASLPLLALGRSQGLATLEVLALISCACGVVMIFKGRSGLTLCSFALAFLLFAVPWPEALVLALTQPLKAAVSAVSESLLHAAGYPVGRAGVAMTVGPYEVMVADACAGLNSMFVLEAISVLYIRLFGAGGRVRDLAIVVLAMPIAFASNVVRVLVLVLLLFHFGDDAARGFIHSFAGLLLMTVAMLLTLAADGLSQAVLRRWRAAHAATAA
jgi:exosortase